MFNVAVDTISLPATIFVPAKTLENGNNPLILNPEATQSANSEKITVLIPMYNASKTVKRCLKNVMAQTFLI